MGLKKNYTVGSLFLDFGLTFLTGGFWLLVVPFKELHRSSKYPRR